MKRFIFLFFVLIIFCKSAYALIKVDITRGNLEPLPIAVSPLYLELGSEEIKIEGEIIEDIDDFIPYLKNNNLEKRPEFYKIYRFSYCGHMR